MYTIYHVVGIKVGCTNDFDRRKIQNQERYGSSIEMEILDMVSDLCGDKFAGDVEWAWSDWFGYPRMNHYSQRWSTVLTPQQLSDFGKRGASTANLGHMTSEERQKHRVGFEHNAWYNGSEKQKADAAKGGKIAVRNEATGFQTGVAGKAGIRSQVANGIHVSQKTLTCPHCFITGKWGPMKRWHFDNCRTKMMADRVSALPVPPIVDE
jgi:hypothetical protein